MDNNKYHRLKYYILPFFIQFVVLCVCVPLHRIFIHIGPYLATPEMVGMEMSDPTAGRLAYAIIAFIAFIAFVIIALCASRKAKKGSVYLPFVLGAFAGTFLWQSIGEDIWHFSVNGIHFLSMESIAVLPLLILFLLFMIFLWKSGMNNWGFWCVTLSFSANWLGHYVLIGIYPLFSNIIEMNTWCKYVGIILGSLLLLTSLYFGLSKEKSSKERMLSAFLSYYAVAVLVFGVIDI